MLMNGYLMLKLLLKFVFSIMFDLTKCRPTEKGQDYIGHINVTQAGVVCQYWSKQFPHK